MNKIVNEIPAITFDDVLIVPAFSIIESRSETSTVTRVGRIELRTPVISANMESVTGLKMLQKMADLGGLGILHRYMSLYELAEIYKTFRLTNPLSCFVAAVGSVTQDKERIDFLIDNNADGICIDIAHGDSLHAYETLHYIRETRGYKSTIIAGNVCTVGAATGLIENGADVVKVGVGPGSVCTTRTKTGCGFPQLQAIIDIATKLHPHQIIADGGLKVPGDIAKALCAGAGTVMVGGMLAGTDAVPGWSEAAHSDEIEHHIVYRGMASAEARKAYGQTGINSEGVSRTILARGPDSTKEVIEDISEGIRSAMSYTGSHTLSEFRNAKFVRVTTTTRAENIPHF